MNKKRSASITMIRATVSKPVLGICSLAVLLLPVVSFMSIMLVLNLNPI